MVFENVWWHESRPDPASSRRILHEFEIVQMMRESKYNLCGMAHLGQAGTVVLW